MPASNTPRQKRRRNLTLSPKTEEIGTLLANRDNRSFSNYVEWLIAREAERIGLTAKEPARVMEAA